jgi:methyl-accepting chemotaxis protein
MQRLASDGVAEVDKNVEQASSKFDAARAAAEDLSNSMDRSAESIATLDERASNTQAFASRIKQFLGL